MGYLSRWTTRLEFLLGKQLPYIAISMINFLVLVATAVVLFKVPLKGSFLALRLGALLYVTATTRLGLLLSTFTKAQIAVIFGTAIATMLPAVQFSGLVDPVSSLEGAGAVMGKLYPTSYFLVISRGTFTKALGFADPYREFLALTPFIPVLTMLSLMLSGSNTPYESMPESVQTLMLFAPTTHFVSSAQAILFRGAGLEMVWPSFLAVIASGTVFFLIALALFRRSVTLTQM